MREDLKEQATGGAQNMSPEEFVKTLRAGVDETYFIAMRGRQIAVRILSVDEVNAIRREGIAYQAKRSGDDVDRDLQVQKLTLALATRLTPGSYPTLTEAMLGLLTVDEVGHLYNEYMLVFARVNPSLETIPLEQFNQLVAAVKKNLVGWKDLSLAQLKAIFTDWAGTIQAQAETQSPTDSGSGGL